MKKIFGFSILLVLGLFEIANAQIDSFVCNADAYLFQGNPTGMYSVDLITGVSTLLWDTIIDEPSDQQLNGFGFNKKDGYMWGYRKNRHEIVRVGNHNYTSVYLNSLPSLFELNCGDVDDKGVMYLTGTGLGTIYRVDLNPYPDSDPVVLEPLQTTPSAIYDWAFNPVDGNLYAVDSMNHEVFRFDKSTGARTSLGISSGGGISNAVYGAAYMDSAGNLYVSANTSGKIYRIAAPHTGNTKASLFAQGPASSVNDGARCSAAPLYCNTQVSISAGKDTICYADSARVCAPAGFDSYQWTPANNNAACVYVKNTGEVYLTVADSNGCTAASNKVNIFMRPKPSVMITVRGDTLKSAYAVSYQWYKNDEPIAGATSNIYIAQTPGLYALQITDANGCVSISEPVTISGLVGMESVQTIAYPNPGADLISFAVEAIADGWLSIYNSGGQKLIEQPYQRNVSIVTLAPGSYFVELRQGTSVWHSRFMKL